MTPSMCIKLDIYLDLCDNMGVVEEVSKAVRQHRPNPCENSHNGVRQRLFNNLMQKRDAVLTVNTSDPSMGQGKQCTVRFKKWKSGIGC